MGPTSKPVWSLINRLAATPPTPHRPKQDPPKRAFRFTKAQTQAVIDDYEAGASMARLAEQYGVRREAISKLLRRSGVTLRVQRAMSRAEIAEAEKLYDSGLSLQKIAVRLGWEDTTIYNQLNRRGVQMRSPHDR